MAINGTFVLDLSMAPALPAGQSYEVIQAANGTRKLLQLSVEEVALPGDYNGDGSVDAADYVLWRKDPSVFGGDPDGYNTWRTNFGATIGGGASSGWNSAVPEPASAFPFLIALLAMVFRRRAAALQAH
jgi:hypothetical protein